MGSTINARKALLGLVGIVLWLAVWQWATTAGPLAGTAGLTSASETLGASIRLAGEPDLWDALGQTLVMSLTGLGIALVLGVLLGILMGLVPAVFAALDPLIQFLRPIPPVVILPLVLLVLGPTRELGMFLATVAALWPILVQVLVGVRDVDPVALDTARAMRLNWGLSQRTVVLPSALPYLVSGARIGATAALLLSIGVGLLAGAPGLGQLILLAQQSGDASAVFALIVWSGLLGLLYAQVLKALEKLLTRGHRPSEVST
ncbi:ABC transporter permease [Streptomyces acidicola]|uniref:ABC transporter permease n=1 Tax=Streptomyces acidicola TaxID=2596892 RepID=UPI0037F97821